MNAAQLASKARKHWAEWLPDKTAELVADGQFAEATMAAAQMAMDEARQLMAQGYPEWSAEEIVLKQYILLEPEPDATEPEWMRLELAEKEREYQEMMQAGEDAAERSLRNNGY